MSVSALEFQGASVPYRQRPQPSPMANRPEMLALIPYSSSDETEPDMQVVKENTFSHPKLSDPYDEPSQVAATDEAAMETPSSRRVEHKMVATVANSETAPIVRPGQKGRAVNAINDPKAGEMGVDEAQVTQVDKDHTKSARRRDFWDDIDLPDLPGVPTQLPATASRYLVDSAQDFDDPTGNDGPLEFDDLVGIGESMGKDLPSEPQMLSENFPDQFQLCTHTAPYSWFIEHPEDPAGVPVGDARARNKTYQVTGELHIELILRTTPLEPKHYFFLCNAFKIVMKCRGSELISEQATASTMRRLFDRFPPLWDAYQRHFIPRCFRFLTFSNNQQKSQAFTDLSEQLKRDSQKRGYMLQLDKILSYLSDGPRGDGRLSYCDTGRDVPDQVYAEDSVGVSPAFMERRGDPWPFNVAVEDSDVKGLMSMPSPIFHPAKSNEGMDSKKS